MSLAMVAGAAAADLAPVYTKAPPPGWSWDGFYIGGGLGSRSSMIDSSVTSATVGNPPVNILTATDCASLHGCPNGASLDSTAFRGSIYAGRNWQIQKQWVLGVEGDVGWGNKTTTLTGNPYPAALAFTVPRFAGAFFPFGDSPNDSFSVKSTWDASARLRAGFVVNPSTLVYATGGAAWTRVNTTSTCSTINTGLGNIGNCAPGNYLNGTLAPAVITDSTTRIGWTIGGGLETMLSANWVLRADYRYSDYGTIHNTDVRTCSGGCNPTTDTPLVISYDTRVRTQTATVGVAYKFDWSGPVVARY
jgi:outer membrane immunogenic protein